MKETVFMRVLFCKIRCPLMCFCKPSGTHVYTSKALKLESAPHIVPPAVNAKPSDEGVKEEESADAEHGDGTVTKSCVRKVFPRPSSTREIRKKKVQWMDQLGKELAEIREFESSDSGDTDNEEESSRCLCAIL
ncbi:uncharacterized protein LOC121747287 [Salvia splendens]|uniref:uncharacterized protein LOC121747287 n=1 Tax=Salvia splendens TaxID=180675 RepID=UPI001C27EE43|nr:uncharacterized protein LOC121747287 [Salvia splendens]XP_041997231.1 uncharacterized protein LOC121747287 [Salvia splendens]XP_041997232.1 uncharacterized protein LOC121747287 [Salvia splendens]